MNVLITSVARKVSLIRAWKKAVNERGGHLIVSDMNPECAGMYEGDMNVRLPAIDTQGFKDLLLGTCLDMGVKLVVPTRDEEVKEFAGWKEEFEGKGIRLLTPSLETVKLCQDKVRFAYWCINNDFKIPKIYENNVQFPAFIRARIGSGSSHSQRLVSHEEYIAAKKRLGDGWYIVQEFIRAPEYSVDVFSDQHGKVIGAVPRERIQIVGGESYVSRTVTDHEIQSEAVRLAEKLHLTGHSVLQCFKRDGEVLWIEANPRSGGASALAVRAGLKAQEWALSEVAGELSVAPLAPYHSGVLMLRYTQDRFVEQG